MNACCFSLNNVPLHMGVCSKHRNLEMLVVVANHVLNSALSAFPSKVVPTGLSYLGSSVTPVRPASPSQMSGSASSKLPCMCSWGESGTTMTHIRTHKMIVTENFAIG